jgi:carbamoyl-phosphate synthase large subunit
LFTRRTAAWLAERGLAVRRVNKVKEGRPHCVDAIINGEVAMVINTTSADPASVRDSFSIRRTALVRDVPYFTTVQAARAAAAAIAAMRSGGLDVRPLQDYHRGL